MKQQLNLQGEENTSEQNLRDRFIVPPFSILDTKEGNWQKKKRKWLNLGIKSEIGRGEKVDSSRERGDGGGREIKKVNGLTFRSTGFMADVIEQRGGGTSIFDPVLCELMYKWFCPAEGEILDPFAGGSVRGIVATKLGFKYSGIELREEQVEANEEQAKKIRVSPEYMTGDSDKILDDIDRRFDFIFSCPPYYNLEVYSVEEGELSALSSYKRFLIKYESIIKKSLFLLKYNRFACFVVANIRDKNGFYLDLAGDTIRLFCKNSRVNFYNDIILVNAIGSLPVRVGRVFKGNRKVGKMHQNVLVFYKGNNPEDIEKLSFLV